jgi:hypothetical protein
LHQRAARIVQEAVAFGRCLHDGHANVDGVFIERRRAERRSRTEKSEGAVIGHGHFRHARPGAAGHAGAFKSWATAMLS